MRTDPGGQPITEIADLGDEAFIRGGDGVNGDGPAAGDSFVVGEPYFATGLRRGRPRTSVNM